VHPLAKTLQPILQSVQAIADVVLAASAPIIMPPWTKPKVSFLKKSLRELPSCSLLAWGKA
jgi:hypothetical protein